MKRFMLPLAAGFCIIMLVGLAGCGNKYKDQVVGTWDTDMPFSPRITLSADGKGSMAVSHLGQSVSKSIEWRLKGSNLIFKIDGKESGGLIKSVDDQKMILHDPDVKKDITFTRVKK